MSKTTTKKALEDYTTSVNEYLIEKYGEIPSHWKFQLKMLRDNIELYLECKETININGIYDVVTGRKNPLLSTVKDLQATIIKQIQHFGLSPYSESKISFMEEDDSDDFINKLTE